MNHVWLLELETTKHNSKLNIPFYFLPTQTTITKMQQLQTFIKSCKQLNKINTNINTQSKLPVEAPLGTAALAEVLSLRVTST